MSFEGRKETSENVQLSYAEVHHVEGYSAPVMPDTETAGRPINLLLTVACIAVGGSSFIFGFDNQVIGPVVALKPFVSDILSDHKSDHEFHIPQQLPNLTFIPLSGS